MQFLALVVLCAFFPGGSTPDVLAHAATVPKTARSSPILTITGDPASATGATWTLKGSLEGEQVDLQGILLKPRGKGPFPAVVLSHGAGGNAQSYGGRLGTVMRKWGMVAIATNYTHARGVPMGTPGSVIDPGASAANTLRAHAVVTVLARLGYVDIRRVAAHGHSMGAFVTTAFVAAHPDDIHVASHTSGGVVLMGPLHLDGIPAPSETQARRIHTPYQWHHGLRDFAVPFVFDRLFDRVLRGVHEGYIYRRLRHAQVADDPTVLERIKAFYTAQGLFAAKQHAWRRSCNSLPAVLRRREPMKLTGIVAAVAISAIPLAAAPQKDSAVASSAGKSITLRGCVAPGVDKSTYVLTQLSEATKAGQSAMPDSAHGRRVVFWLDKKSEMLKHVNQAVEVTGTINGFEDSEIELKNGDAKDGGLLVEFEGPGKDVRVSNAVIGGAVGTAGQSTPEKNDIKTMLVKVNVTGVIVTADYPCAQTK